MTGTCTAQACTPACIPGAEAMETATAANAVGRTRRALRLLGLVAALGAGLCLLAALTSWPGRGRQRRAGWALKRLSRWVLRSLGVRLAVHGAPRTGPSVVVGNHVSWLDVLALSASAPMRMVAKSEVGQWPVIGGAARRCGTIFLERDRLSTLPATVADITAALRAGSRVQVFPEGTTRCGSALNPFRRAAFQAAVDAGVVISPVTIRYTDGQDGFTAQPAFLGAESLLESVRRVLAVRSLTVRVHWLRPIPAIAGTGRDAVDRATVALLAQNSVARNLGLPVLGGTACVTAPAVRVGSAEARVQLQSAQRPR